MQKRPCPEVSLQTENREYETKIWLTVVQVFLQHSASRTPHGGPNVSVGKSEKQR